MTHGFIDFNGTVYAARDIRITYARCPCGAQAVAVSAEGWPVCGPCWDGLHRIALSIDRQRKARAAKPKDC